ncbi:MAG: helix-turn-helix transcriptional regulator [Clostridia bacterium]|nr:helix-turn-helix transcriptional regulator [Clostridia bacterium]
MNVAFPRILTLLRKERGISQKQAAAALEVSQALLSHYEKGIRECGLDFVIRAANYYQVSCDYLLGRTADKSGAILKAEDIPEDDPNLKDYKYRGSVLPVLNKKLTLNSVSVVYELLQKLNNKALTTEVSAFFSLSIYAVFRKLYAANPKNPRDLFSVPDFFFPSSVMAEMIHTDAVIGALTEGKAVAGEPGLPEEAAPALSTDKLAAEYPMFASSLLNLLRNAEGRLSPPPVSKPVKK